MSGTILAVECPKCGRTYNVYPGPEEYMRALVTRHYEMECDRCEEELTFRVVSGAKAPFTTGGS